MVDDHRRPVSLPTIVVSIALVLTVVAAAGRSAAETVLPDVNVTLVVDVRDVAAWLALHAEALRTAPDVPKPLGVTAAGPDGPRTIVVTQPRFEAKLTGGSPLYRVVVHGRVNGAEAITTLTGFQQALFDGRGDAGAAPVLISYGLSSLTVDFVELQITR